MPRQPSPSVDKERSTPHPSRSSIVPDNPIQSSPSQPIPSAYPAPGEVSILSQPTYSQTILQPPTLATDTSSLPPQSFSAGPSSATSRRASSGSMRNASMTFEHVQPTSTPTGRISKAKKGKRVHACEFPGCGKVFTRAEHKRRHELNHNPEAIFRCQQLGCGKTFHRLDLLQRHQERHEFEVGSPSLSSSMPQHGNFYTAPLSILPSSSMASPTTDAVPRSTSGGVSIGNLINPPQSQFATAGPTIGFGMYYPSYPQTVDPYYYGSEGSRSPASESFAHTHRHSISEASSVHAFDPSALSPVMTTSMPGTWSTPPIALPSNALEEGVSSFTPSLTASPVPQHLRELDGHEFATIQRELSLVPGLIFDANSPDLPRYIRSDCLELYWKHFHPSFPIVYKPNFLTDKPPPLLLSAVLAIGSYYDSRPDAKLYSLALQEIATKLLRQRENITAKSRIADLQTVLLLEILCKFCARQISPESSARFRALYASLHQSQQMIVQDPLAVFKTLKDERTDRELKTAHKFWLENEARRRIFHACNVLDAQQVALFGQRPIILAHSSFSERRAESRGGNDLPCREALWNATPMNEWSQEATMSLPLNMQKARATYITASVDDYSFFQHQIINSQGLDYTRCSDEVPSPPPSSMPISKTRFNYHVFQMTRCLPVRQILIVAGESWLLGQKVEQQADCSQARRILREWLKLATTRKPDNGVANCVQAHWHALKVLRLLVDSSESSDRWRTTYMLHEDWSVYLAVLICWAHSYGRNVALVRTRTIATTSTRTSPIMSRKRKADGDTSPSRKRQSTGQSALPSAFMPSSAAHTTQMPQSSTSTAFADPQWAFYGQAESYAWPASSYYDPLIGYDQTGQASNLADATAYTSSVATTALTRTATNTPQSQASLATTTATTLATPAADASMQELKTYLSLTDVYEPQELLNLDSTVHSHIKGVLTAVRIHKIGAKHIVGGLMNDAHRVLSRLAKNRNNNLF